MKIGVEEFLNTYRSSTVSSIAYQMGYDVNVIGGKSDVVSIMSFDSTYLSVELSLSKFGKNLAVGHFGSNKELTSSIWKRYSGTGEFSTIDESILRIWEDAQSKLPSNNQLWIVTLPLLDTIGHKFGPKSPETISHVKRLDYEIAKILSNNDADIILTGDHGCRRVKDYFVEAHEVNPKKAIIYKETQDNINYVGDISLQSKGVTDVQYDGGLLRIKLEPNSQLYSEVRNSLSRFGCVIPFEKATDCMDHSMQRMYNNSICPNLYDVVVIANPDTMFCKFTWLPFETLEDILHNIPLANGMLPKGEHGTHYIEDSIVPVLSNFTNGDKQINNVQIKNMIAKLLI